MNGLNEPVANLVRRHNAPIHSQTTHNNNEAIKKQKSDRAKVDFIYNACLTCNFDELISDSDRFWNFVANGNSSSRAIISNIILLYNM